MNNRTIDEFTEEERKLISDIYRRNCQNLTPDEQALLDEWIAANNAFNAEYEQEYQTLQANLAANIATSNTAKAVALQNLTDLKDTAVAFYESTLGVDENEQEQE